MNDEKLNRTSDEADDRLDRAIRAMLAQPAPQEVRQRVVETAANWKADSVAVSSPDPRLKRSRRFVIATVAIAVSLLLAVAVPVWYLLSAERTPNSVLYHETQEHAATHDAESVPHFVSFERQPSTHAFVAHKAPVIVARGPNLATSLGRQVPRGDDIGALHVWDWSRSTKSRVVQGVKLLWLEPLAVSPDGKMVLRANGEAIDLSTGVRKQVAGFANKIRRGHRLRFSPDGKRVALFLAQYDGDQIVGGLTRIIDLARGKVLSEFPAGDGFAQWLAFLSDGNSVVLANLDRVIQRRNVVTGDVMTRYEPALKPPDVLAVAVSPTGRYVAASQTHGELFIWEAEAAKLVQNISDVGTVKLMRFSPDGKLLATAYSRSLTIYETTTGRVVARLGQRLPSWASHLRWSKDGDTITVVVAAHIVIHGNAADPATQVDDIYPAVYHWDWKTGKLRGSR